MAEKILVETHGNFMLMDIFTGCVIEAHRPSVVERSAFMTARIGLGQVEVLAKLVDDATDAELATYVKEAKGDMELAIESFKSKFEAGNKLTKKRGGGEKSTEA